MGSQLDKFVKDILNTANQFGQSIKSYICQYFPSINQYNTIKFISTSLLFSINSSTKGGYYEKEKSLYSTCFSYFCYPIYNCWTEGRVIENLNPSGLIKTHGEIWKAVSNDKKIIKKGNSVEIVKVEGLLLFVKKIKDT